MILIYIYIEITKVVRIFPFWEMYLSKHAGNKLQKGGRGVKGQERVIRRIS